MRNIGSIQESVPNVPSEDDYCDSQRFPGKKDSARYLSGGLDGKAQDSALQTHDAIEMTTHAQMMDGDDKGKINPIIFKRGVKHDCFYLVLNGKVSICSGREGFMMEKGIFNYMGEQCITNDDYVPDFSAKVIGKTRLLRVSKADYNAAKIKFQNII